MPMHCLGELCETEYDGPSDFEETGIVHADERRAAAAMCARVKGSRV